MFVAFGDNGMLEDPEVDFPDGVKLRLHKDWAYLENEDIWNAIGKGRYEMPTFAEISEGTLQFGNLYVDVRQLEMLGSDEAGAIVFAKWSSNEVHYFAGVTKYSYPINDNDVSCLFDYIGGEYASEHWVKDVIKKYSKVALATG